MRLVRLERQQSRVADDVRAALASLGRGSTVIGGIALVGVGAVTERPIEAVVLLPHGVIIVIGVDLPDPALRLEAPLGAAWKADGWPLVAEDDAINPATEALDASQACERRIAALVPGTAPVGTIVAVGPYVETVDQPAADLAGPVRVLHPTPTAMLAATVSLATAHHPQTVEQVRALIRGLAPEAPEFSDEILLGEGFRHFPDDSVPESIGDAGPALPPQPAAASTAVSEAAAVPVMAGPGSAGAARGSDWRTATPAPVAPEPAAAASPAPDPEPQPEPDLAPVAEAAPPHAPAEAAALLAESESTEVLTPEKTAESPALPRFPGTEAPAPTRPAPAEPSGADTERTESLTFPTQPGRAGATSTEAARPGQAGAPPSEPALPAPRPAEPGAASAKPGHDSPPPFPTPRPTPQPVSTAPASRTVRWLPLGAIGLLVALGVAAVVVATSGEDTAAAPPAGTSVSPPKSSSTPTPAPSLQFALRAADHDQRCASHAFGDAQASLQQTSCSGVRRASYATTVDGRAGAVTVGIVEFDGAAQAAAFKAIVDTPGAGGILDLATETGQWGATPVPRFENAVYASKLDGSSVRLVQAVWTPGPSTTDDPGLTRAAKAALDLPAQ
ncbi:hypothetical protein [Amycolatopsis sp. cmx-4-68]|uniref:hypothetical protein n=1 Tax=Amycolatopsis sp. cmx-4-68 TaxID=2790938 RepID=UPI00397A0FDC